MRGSGLSLHIKLHKWVAVFNEITSVIGREVNFLDLHTGVEKVGDFVLERELQDLAAYYEDENFRSTARQRLIDKLREHTGKRIMLIGHSMGSIIAYDVLRIVGRQTPPVPVDHFITIGSPPACRTSKQRSMRKMIWFARLALLVAGLTLPTDVTLWPYRRSWATIMKPTIKGSK